MNKLLHFILVEGSIIISIYFAATFAVIMINQLTSNNFEKRLKSAPLGIGNLFGALFGAFTPFCSCTTVPILEGMQRSKIRFGILITFLFASPLVNEIVIIILVKSFGILFTITFIALALLLSILVGIGFDKLNLSRLLRRKEFDDIEEIDGYVGNDQETKIPFPAQVKLSFFISLNELKKAIPYIAVGLIIGGSVYGFIPEEWFEYLGNTISANIQIIVFSIVGAPLYVNMITALPVAVALLGKGLTIGPLVAFLIAGAGTSISEMILLFKVFRLPLLITFILTMILSAIFMGFFFHFFSKFLIF